jgi:hypothetical protein
MKNRLTLLTLAAGVLLWGFAATEAKAAGTLVTSDAGDFSWSLSSNGSGTAILTFTNVGLTTVNGTTIATVSSSLSTLTIAYTELTGPPPTGSYTFNFVSTGTKTFGTGGASASLSYSTTTAGTNLIGSLGIDGTIPAVTNPITNALPGFDFSPFASGGNINLSLSDTGVDIGKIIVSGGSASGTGGFTENAVPEPASLALLGIGMTGFLAFRRYFKKTSVS